MVEIHASNTRHEESLNNITIDYSYFENSTNNERLSSINDTTILDSATGQTTVLSSPLNKNLERIDTTITVLNKTSGDSHAGLVWADGYKTYYVFLRLSGKVSFYDSENKEYLQNDTINIQEGTPYNLSVIHENDTLGVYVDGERKLDVLDPDMRPLVANVGVRGQEVIAAFNPIIVVHNNTDLSTNVSLSAISEIQEMLNSDNTFVPVKIADLRPKLENPTNMAFLSENDILVLEKDTGKVRRVVDGSLLDESLLDVNVATQTERGMLGIAISKDQLDRTFVFLYFTEAEEEGVDECPGSFCDIDRGERNRLYRYEFNGTKLVDPILLLDLPAFPGPRHNGGELMIGPDNNLYLTVGDVDLRNQAQNIRNGGLPAGSGGILRITQDGQAVEGIIGTNHPLDKYYAYGIRNSFGIDFDPVTNELWDTENGPARDDEINYVNPGFNSGWVNLTGKNLAGELNEYGFDLNELVDFNGKGEYRNPELTWTKPVGLTAAQFLDTEKYGAENKNDLLVSDIHNGHIYHFKLNEDRTELVLEEGLKDKVADTPKESESLIVAKIPGGITDLQMSPNGFVYALGFGEGSIYKLLPGNDGKGEGKGEDEDASAK